MARRSSDRRRAPGAVAAGLLALGLGACALGPEGPVLYGELGDEDVALAAAAKQDALEHARDGETRRWSNAESGRSGAVTPVRTLLTEDGRFCRDYEEELRVAGEAAVYEHRACRDDEGRWVWL